MPLDFGPFWCYTYQQLEGYGKPPVAQPAIETAGTSPAAKERKNTVMKLNIETDTTGAAFIPKICVLGATAENIAATKTLVRVVAAGRKVEIIDNPLEATTIVANSPSQIAPWLGTHNEFDERAQTQFVLLTYGLHVLPKHVIQLPVYNGGHQLAEKIFLQPALKAA